MKLHWQKFLFASDGATGYAVAAARGYAPNINHLSPGLQAPLHPLHAVFFLTTSQD